MAKEMTSNAVSVLPPTIGIKDPSTRSFLDALTNLLDARSGYTDRDAPERFITAAEFQGLATRAISRAFSGAGALPGDPDGKIPSAIEVQESIENLADSIRKSLVYQILGEQFGLIDIDEVRRRIGQIIVDMENGFAEEREARADENEALTTSISVAVSRLGESEAAIAIETETRATKDTALASAINTMWAEVGGAGSVIQDGSLASATPSSTKATKWRQVQSAVTDPNTGLVASAAMREDFTTYASNVDGRFNSLYSVRAQLSTGGVVLSGIAATGPTASLAGSTALRLSANAPVGTAPGMYVYGTGLDGLATVVGVSGAVVTLSMPLGLNAGGAYTFTTNKMLIGGFGLAATGDSGSSQGGTIDFGVRADKFFIAATSATPDAQTQINQGSSIPFMVLTSYQYVNGVVYAPGVYIKKAVIGEATIGTAQIAEASVDTLRVQGNAITGMSYGEGGGGVLPASGVANVASASIIMPSGSSGVLATMTINMAGAGSNATVLIEVIRGGAQIKSIGVSLLDGFVNTFTFSAFDPAPIAGLNTYQMVIRNASYGPGSNAPVNFNTPSITLSGARR